MSATDDQNSDRANSDRADTAPSTPDEDAISPQNARVFKLILFGITAIIALVMLEVGLKVAAGAGMISPRILPHENLQYTGTAYARHAFDATERVVTLADGRSFPINAHGYRSRPFEITKPAGVQRVVVFGGSQVFDQNVSGHKDWPQAAGDLLNKRGLHVEVINAGIPGHSAVDAVGRLLTEVHRWQPDVVVLCNMWNDLKDFRYDGPLLRKRHPMASSDPRTTYFNVVDKALCHISRLYTTVRQRYLTWSLGAGAEGVLNYDGRIDAPPAAGLARYKLHVASFVDIARNAGAEPLLMLQARLPSEELDEASWKKVQSGFVGFSRKGLLAAYKGAEDAIAAVALAKSVTVIDANSAVPSDKEHFGDHVHVSPKGSEVLAKTLADALAPVLSAKKQR